MNTSQALEMARCAEINLDNMGIVIPGLKTHPIFVIVKMQIKECIKNLDGEEE